MKRPILIAAILLTPLFLAMLNAVAGADEPLRRVERIAAMPQTLPTPIFEFRPLRPTENSEETPGDGPAARLNIEPLPQVEGETGAATNPYAAYEFPSREREDRISSPSETIERTPISPAGAMRTAGFTVRQTPVRRSYSQMRPQVYVGPYTGFQTAPTYGSAYGSVSSRPDWTFSWH